MRRIKDSEIDEMRARRYDAATIREAREAFERGKVADRLIDRIAEAFSGVSLGWGVGLQEAQGLDDHEDEATCAAYRETDEKDDWRKIAAADLNRCNSSLSFFDADGMRFHLPAYMTADLRGEYGFGMAYALTQVSDFERYYSALDSKQRRIVREYLLFLLDDPDCWWDQPHIDRALEDYWTESATTTEVEPQR